MGTKRAFIIGFEKRANAETDTIGAMLKDPVKHIRAKLPHWAASPVEAYRAAASKPSFKVKKMIGKGLLATGGVAYLGNKLLQDTPDEQMSADTSKGLFQ